MNGKQSSSGMRVRDMVLRYDTALKTESGKSLFSSSIGASKSSYFGLNENHPIPVDDNDDDFDDLYVDETRNASVYQRSPGSSSGSQKTVRQTRYESLNDIPAIPPLDTQKSFMNLSRSKEPPRAAPREKKPRHSSSFQLESAENKDEHMNTSDSSYQSKTTISKTPNGVRIIVDIFFDQNKGLAIEDVIGSRIETDIPPSKILKEFQKRVAEASQD